ncbi:hypothetical protein ABB37_06675 [Leptomonas pyrrhocoris]|uniref:Uncharacterized protein n=1 Tax=Leptomonas pyrrhocoris TaxID=157538 RepID=A0A0M9FXB6_LEPPY|nr:hypothetical protein ABB37_06675 [Leptomonas pyrrhocoris]KPA77883.1 hypothetical protein ABB37_06675 [Leptomonas pyrrhocoris]|eukprot:XP_015656322.1 hypothetical protein ABB37_06675 [Leptomonas pyrrhocoris]
MVQSSQYPEERQARRILELSYPEVDEEVRENLAYLVSARRMTLDDALAKLDTGGGGIQKHKATKPTTTTTAPAQAPLTSCATNGRRAGPTGSTAAEALRQRKGLRNDGAEETGRGHRRVNDDGEEAAADYRRGNARHTTTTTAPAGSRSKATEKDVATPTKAAAAGYPAVSSRSARPTISATPPKAAASSRLGNSISREVRYNRNRSDTRVSRSDSELTELRESSRSLVRSEDDCGQHSAPDLLNSRAAGDMGSGSASLPRQRYTAASTRTGARWREVDEDSAAAAAALEPRNKAAWAELAEKRQVSSSSTNGVSSLRSINDKEDGNVSTKENTMNALDDGEPMLTDAKLVTDEEKAAYEDRMKDMMHYWYRDETSMFDYTLRSMPTGQVLFFTTSMTGDRKVRDHCRLMENMLYLKLIPHHTIDVADSEFFQRRVRRMYTHSTQKRVMPDMPLLFVDDKLIGDFTAVQELEDAGELDAKLLEAGCSVLRPRAVAQVEAKLAGLPGTRLVLPASVPQRINSKSTAEGDSTGTSARPTAAKKRAATTATTAPAVDSTQDKRQAREGDGEHYPVLSPLTRRTNTSEVVSLAGRPPPPLRTPSTKSADTTSHPPPTSSSPSAPNRDRRLLGSEPARVHDDDIHLHDPINAAPSSATRRDSSGTAPRVTTGAAISSSGATAHSENRNVRASARNTLGHNDTCVADAEKYPTTSSAVPRLPSLSSRNRETYNADLTSPSARTSNTRRYSAQPRAAAGAAAVSRVELC